MKHISPKSTKTEASYKPSPQDARQAHSLLQNSHFPWLGHSETERKPSPGRGGGTATKLPPCPAWRWLCAPRGVFGLPGVVLGSQEWL